jgi:hypothetical protein
LSNGSGEIAASSRIQKVSAHRGNSGNLHARRRETLDQAPEDFCLFLSRAFREVPGHLPHIGVDDRQVQGNS